MKTLPTSSPYRRAFAKIVNWIGGNGSLFDSVNNAPHRSQARGSRPRDTKHDLTPWVREEIVRRSRYVHRNSGFTREQSINMQLYGVGCGIRPQARSVNATFNRESEKHFRRWGRTADIAGRFSFDEIQALVSRAIDRDGEIFIHKVKDSLDRPRLQLIPSHRIVDLQGDPSTVDGIALGPYGEAVAYRVLQDDGTTKDVPANFILHVFEADDESSVRFCPPAQHSINHVMDEMDLLALEKHAAKDNADKSLVLTKAAANLNDEGDFKIGEDGKVAATDVVSLQNIVGGKLVAIEEGEKLESFVSQRPSTTFTGFLEYLKRDSALGHVPYEFAADSSSIGGAGVRLVVTKAERRFGWRTKTIADRLIRGVWEFVIGDAIAKGILEAVEDWNEVEYTTPRKVSVDAGREAQANRDDIELGIKTLEEHFSEQGKDFEREMEKRAQNARRIIEIAEEYKVPLEMLWSPSKGAPQLPAGPTAPPPRADDPATRTTVQPD